jgi:hypothetical protein
MNPHCSLASLAVGNGSKNTVRVTNSDLLCSTLTVTVTAENGPAGKRSGGGQKTRYKRARSRGQTKQLAGQECCRRCRAETMARPAALQPKAPVPLVRLSLRKRALIPQLQAALFLL